MTLLKRSLVALAAAGCAMLSASRVAEACGCFTPPDPSVPIVQAGERILFATEKGIVTAHIQIQYAGNAGDFGWILPLPSIPDLELGTDELFNQLINQTQPKYRLLQVYEDTCFIGKGGTASEDSGGFDGPPGSPNGGSSPLVIQDSIGPYDYAVLRADSKEEMLKWLADNHYFVPAGTDGVVAPYIHKDAYFLALKLHSGASTGDLQPVVVRYASDLPMIPIVLTSVAAQPDMGIQVWMLGKGRAIPRNYFHTVINDAKIDWSTAGSNYNEVIIAATKEAEGRHTFVTEFAGSSAIMRGILDRPGRFGTQEELAARANAIEFVTYLNGHGFVTFTQPTAPPFFVQPTYSSQILSILGRYVPVPAIPDITPGEFYSNITFYLGSYRAQHPEQFAGYEITYKPAEMAAEIHERVVKPTLEAGALFAAHPYLTRLYTTLSPAQMNRDPVFSFNVGLPDVKNVHEATLTYHCPIIGYTNINKVPATLKTEQGWTVEYPSGVGPSGLPGVSNADMPMSRRIERVFEEGAPEVVVDNSGQIRDALDDGCNVAPGGSGLGSALLVALAIFLRRRLT